MAAILDQIRLVVEQIIHASGYPGIALVMFIENLIPPIPSEVVMPFAGFLVAEGDEMTFVGVIIAGAIGALLGAILLYYLAHWLGEERVRRWIEQTGKYVLLSTDDYDQVMNAFEDHGKKVVLLARLVPGLRSLISIPAGLNNMNIWQFLFYTVLGTIMWNTLLAGAGYYLGRNWERVLDFVDTYETILWTLGVIFLTYFIIKRLGSRLAPRLRDSFGGTSD